MPSADVKELWATNEANLVAIASDVDLFADYLALMGTHTRKSPMNLASIQAHGDYADKTVLKTREEWDDLVGVQNADDGTYRSAVKDDAEAIPVVCSRGRNAFAIDYLYPLEALDRRPSQNTYLGRPAKIDLGRNDDAAVFAAAKAHLKGEKGIDLEKLPANALFAIEARYGLPHTVEPVLPTLEVKELKAELSELSKQVDKVAFLLDRSIRYNRSQHRAAHAPKVAAVNERFASAASALKEEAAREPSPKRRRNPRPRLRRLSTTRPRSPMMGTSRSRRRRRPRTSVSGTSSPSRASRSANGRVRSAVPTAPPTSPPRPRLPWPPSARRRSETLSTSIRSDERSAPAPARAAGAFLCAIEGRA